MDTSVQKVVGLYNMLRNVKAGETIYTLFMGQEEVKDASMGIVITNKSHYNTSGKMYESDLHPIAFKDKQQMKECFTNE